MSVLEKRIISLRYYLLGAKYYEASSALELVLEHFEGHQRKDGSPVVGHFVSVAQFVRTLSGSLQFPDVCLAVALLHDIVEDSPITYSDLSSLGFSSQVVNNVALLTKNTEDKSVRKNPTTQFDMIAASPISSIVKGADRIHNFDTMLGVFSAEKQMEYVEECTNLIIPMIKTARRKFFSQEPAYENIMTILHTQIKMVSHNLMEIKR